MIQENQLTPNIVTFGCLAAKVSTVDELSEFLRDLKVIPVLKTFKYIFY